MVMAEENNHTSDTSMREVEGLLVTELEREKKSTKNATILGAVLTGFIFVYVTWAFVQFSRMLDPNNLAEFVTGFALDEIPAASKTLKQTLVEGAPGIAHAASQQLVEFIPAFRASLEEEIDPIIDDTADTLAAAWVQKMLAIAKDEPNRKYADQVALAHASDALVVKVRSTLDGMMDEPMEDLRTPRQVIHSSLAKLEKIDRELKRVAEKKGDAKEREFLISWLNLVNRYGAHVDYDIKDAKKGPKTAARAPKKK